MRIERIDTPFSYREEFGVAIIKNKENMMSGDSVKDTIAIITGASKGIGKATAAVFLESGAKVVLVSKQRSGLEDTASEFEKKYQGQILPITADVRDWDEVQRMGEKAVKTFGRIDILVNNAGVAYAGDAVDNTKEEIDEIIDVNVKGVVYCARAVLPQMIKQKSGILINIASGAGKTGIPGLAVYSASKFAVCGFTEALAGEVASYGIRVYAICPGAVATDMQKQISGGYYGMPPEKIANKIFQVAGSNPPIDVGECLEVYR